MVRLLLAPAVEPPKNSCRMNRVFSIFLLLHVMAMVICRGKTIGKCVRQHKRAILGAVGHCEEFDPVLVHRAMMEERLHRQDGSLRRCPTIRCCGERMPCHSHQMGHKGSDDAPQLRARWVAQEFRGRCGDKQEYFSETPDLALVKAVIAHAARRAVAVFDVRRAYFCAEEKRDIFVELPDFVPAEFRTTHVGEAAQGVVRNSPSCSIVER